MGTKRSRSDVPSESRSTDDLSRIHGIGPALAQRLQDAGILTYSNLAALTPDEISRRIGAKAGASVARITEEDWVGQARALAMDQAPALEPAGQETPAAESELANIQAAHGSHGLLPAVETPNEREAHERLAMITVRLELDVNDAVRETQVTYVRTGSDVKIQRRWRGWEAERLLRFVQEQVERYQVVEPPTGSGDPAGGPVPSLPPKSELETMARELVPISKTDEKPRPIVDHSVPVAARLALDLTLLPPAVASPETYTVAFQAKRLGSSNRVVLGEAHGSIQAGNQLIATASARRLPPGLYRLEALVTLQSGAGSWPAPAGAPLRGELVLVT